MPLEHGDRWRFPRDFQDKCSRGLLGAWGLGVWAEPRHYGVTWRGMVTWRGRFGVRPVTLGARHVNDDSLGLVIDGLGFEDDGTVRVEELVGDVSEDGGAAGGDASFGDEGEEAGEELADVRAGVEPGEFGEEVSGEVCRVVLWRLGCSDQGGVAETEVRAGVENGETAAGTVGGEMAAAGRLDGTSITGFGSHCCSFLGTGGYTLRGDEKSA